MAEGKSTVRVKMRVGEVEFEIECAVDELRDVVDKVLASVAESSMSSRAVVGTIDQRRPGSLAGHGETCKSVILGLWNEGWFEIGRSLGEVHGEMGRQGFHYDRTAVAHALVDLVREGILTRMGRPRRYRYLQKRPASNNVPE
ncbi:MAG: hypothetical protein NWE78_01375 [Candidatus Bathyarchaeota archaeon]|nr:hypothetical protein [Candidatus Bathyarchaeota archaeon]